MIDYLKKIEANAEFITILTQKLNENIENEALNFFNATISQVSQNGIATVRFSKPLKVY